MQNTNKRYGLAPDFERAVAVLTATDEQFMARIGSSLDPELLQHPDARHIVEAAQAIEREHGQGCDGSLLVTQRLFATMRAGRLKYPQVVSAIGYMEDAYDAGLPPVEAAIKELQPVVQQHIRDCAVRSALDDLAKRGDFARARDLLDRADTVGVNDTSAGVLLGTGSFAAIDALRDIDRLPTGIEDLDVPLGGGASRGQLNLILADSGVGKSMLLSQICAAALLQGAHCGYATLELPQGITLARMKAALTNVLIDDIMAGDELVRQRIAQLEPELGICRVKEFSPHATTVEDVYRWVRVCEQRAGRQMDALFVDYADKLSGPREDVSDYTLGRIVFEGLRVRGRKRGMWTWTASQATRRQLRGRTTQLLDNGDTSDSLHKVRCSNLIFTLNPRDRDDGDVEMTLFVSKNTVGRSRFSVGPLPTERAVGRVVPSLLLSQRWVPNNGLYEGL